MSDHDAACYYQSVSYTHLDVYKRQIIYSTVRTKNSIGFQKEKERVNVAFSRAKNLLIICGDMDFFYKFDDPDNKFIEIIDYICEHEDECLVIPGGEI